MLVDDEDFPLECVFEQSNEDWLLKSGSHLDCLCDDERFWFGDPSQLLPYYLWMKIRADMARYMAGTGESGGQIILAGQVGMWQAIKGDFEGSPIEVPVSYPGGSTSIRIESPILMALPVDVAELFRFPCPGLTTNPFFGRIIIDSETRNWEGSIEVIW